MSDPALEIPLDTEGFLAWEARQPERWELISGVVRMMAGGSDRHDAVCNNLRAELVGRLRGRGCWLRGPDMRLVTPAGDVAYPDAFVRCGEPDPAATHHQDPVVVFEVLSPSTASFDLTRKKRAYQTIPTLRALVYLVAEEALALIVRRHGELWQEELVEGLDATLELPEIGISLRLSDIYADVPLDPQASTAGWLRERP
jgi:Uma2 family endonuclease